jgi:tetratricopeptide (TPR) repeat protein
VDRILGAPGDEGGYKQDRKHRREREQPEPKQQTHKEAAAEDINVGSYYLDKKNWRAAQSRYQSAMVLDPENPEVYWGLAESAYHLGDLAAARGYYLKVFEYDPDGPHGKQLKKILKDPALLNAKAIVAVAPATPDQQKP